MRHLRLESRFPRKRIWPWVALAAVLLSVGVVELSVRAAQHRAAEDQSVIFGIVNTPAADAGSVDGGRDSGVTPGASPGPAAAGISGVVRLPGGGPAAGIGVFVEPAGQETRTDAKGAFHLDLPDGSIVRVHAHHSDVGFGSVEAVAPSSTVSVTLQPRATFDVRVMAGGRPTPGVQVVAEETVERVYEADHLTDAEGRVRIRGLPAGQLRVRATLPTGARGFTDADAHEGEAVEVTVQLRGP
jgi:hypothetical protein